MPVVFQDLFSLFLVTQVAWQDLVTNTTEKTGRERQGEEELCGQGLHRDWGTVEGERPRIRLLTWGREAADVQAPGTGRLWVILPALEGARFSSGLI